MDTIQNGAACIGSHPVTEIERLRAERDSFRSVLEGAGYQHIDDIARNSIEDSLKLGSMVADITMRLQKERDALQQLLNARDEEIERLKQELADERLQSLADGAFAEYCADKEN